MVGRMQLLSCRMQKPGAARRVHKQSAAKGWKSTSAAFHALETGANACRLIRKANRKRSARCRDFEGTRRLKCQVTEDSSLSFFFLFFSKRSYLRAVVSRSVEQSEVAEGTEGFLAECLPKRKACPQGAMRFFFFTKCLCMSTEECVYTWPGKDTMRTCDHFYFIFYFYRSKV